MPTQFGASVWSYFASTLEYETTKVVQIKSVAIGLSYRLIQGCFLVYICVYVMWLQRGYQYFDKVESGVVVKVKGVQMVPHDQLDGRAPPLNQSVWDAYDLLVPAQQNSGFFVTTNLVPTARQRQGACDESTDVYHAACVVPHENTSQSIPPEMLCEKGRILTGGSGVQTGRCIRSSQKANLRTCEIEGWCPTENDVLPIPGKSVFPDVKNFTVIVKNSVVFHHYGVRRRNILDWMENDGTAFMKTCRYEPNDARMKYCPIFTLHSILKHGEGSDKNIWTYGGVVSITIRWDCNLDHGVEYCLPEYSFQRMDDPEATSSRGWNFRHATYSFVNGTYERTLYKRYGVQFFLNVVGKAGKFDFVVFTMNVGSGIALLSLATVVMDMFILNVTRNRKKYRDARTDLMPLEIDQQALVRKEIVRYMGRLNPLVNTHATNIKCKHSKNSTDNLKYNDKDKSGSENDIKSLRLLVTK